MTPALVIIDMQHDFVDSGAPLAVPGAQEAVPVIRRLLDDFREQSWPVFHVSRIHRLDGMDVELARMPIFTVGAGACVQGTPGSKIVSELAPLEGEFRIRKRRFSAFMYTDFDLVLRRVGANTLVIAGCQYPTSIRATVMDAVSLDYQVIVVTDACTAQSPDIAEANIRDLRNIGVFCVPSDEVADTLRRLSDDDYSDC